MNHFFWVLLALCACGAPSRDDAGSAVDAGTTSDAGTDAGITWSGVIQPLLWAKCAACHGADAGQLAFAASYPVMFEPSRLCVGDRVGDCVSLALEAQTPEGSGCRTVVVRPFHREPWSCLTPDEVGRVVGWVDAGMNE